MEISAGLHTFSEVLGLADIEVDQAFDRRRLKVGGLSFDDPEQTFRVPAAAETLEVVLDGEVVASFTVNN